MAKRLSAAIRREQLMRVALTEFGRRGFHLTQMEHVAVAAGVSKALLYQHFESKEQLFGEVAQAIVDDLTGRLAAVDVEGATSLERIGGMVATLFDYATAEPDAWAVIIRHLDKPEVGVELRELRDRFGEAAAGRLLSRRRKVLSPEALAKHERRAPLLIPLIYGSLFSQISWWLEHPEVPRARAESAALDFIWLGLERLREGEHLSRS
ncbi:TetR/AcrR family transcriptional regulator [Actinocorallia sp. A-T 12471]|uniref:TetR/AcrR family transcriptional regulator n=1 Tax=Actinocorallia sp. A-T 12471 TaxID=3089813 RepID=UPI0029CC1A6B|nr:TetR/AcrR family transcriptional regulator [Actinocorallia sp. A-T 12471]MDX6740332.1 TetR/AcrR family transcriptional regulator [Actinocorallia sp. A-T 12471]